MPQDKNQDTPEVIDDDKRAGILKRGAQVARYIVSPYVFSRKDSNPFRDTNKPWKTLIKSAKLGTNRTKFKNLEQVQDDNPEFEVVRKYALVKLKKRRLIISVIFLIWCLYSIFNGGFHAFDYSWMNSFILWIYTSFMLMFLVVTDIQYLVFKHRLLKLTLIKWIGIRFGFK